MIHRHFLILLLVSTIFFKMNESGAAPADYPSFTPGNTKDIYHGVEVADPYRELEDANSPKTVGWLKQQDEFTDHFFAAIPQYEQIRKVLAPAFEYTKTEVPIKAGEKYFFFQQLRSEAQKGVYVTDSIVGKARLLVSPDELSKDGSVVITNISPSPDGKLLAYAVSKNGSEFHEWRIRNVETGKDVPNQIVAGARWPLHRWSPDGKGFYYERFPQKFVDNPNLPLENHQIFYHSFDSPNDRLLLTFQEGFFNSIDISADKRYVIVSYFPTGANMNIIYILDLQNPEKGFIPITKQPSDSLFTYMINEGSKFYFRSTLNAPLGRIISIDLNDASKITDVIPEQKDALVFAEGVPFSKKLFTVYQHDVVHQLKIFDLAGVYLNSIKLPSEGVAGGRYTDDFFIAEDSSEIFFQFEYLNRAPSIYRYDTEKNAAEIWSETKIAGFDPDQFQTEQVFYPGKDGTKIPMFIAYKKGMIKSGKNPTILYAYGSYGMTNPPIFDSRTLGWMQLGGIWALANIRGGGEYGEEWHKAGQRLHKQTTFDDFIAGEEYLINQKYTSSDYLAADGRSAGGLLIGVVTIQRPDLIRVAIPEVPVLDMLRYLGSSSVGQYNVPEMGDSSNEDDFKVLYHYSPVHNIHPGTNYPAILVVPSVGDVRCPIWHSAKFVAALQAAQKSDLPILLLAQKNTGHAGTGQSADEVVQRWAKICTFTLAAMGALPAK